MKVALIQQKFHGTKDATVQRTLELVREASGGGAELVVLQELHQTQYFCQSEETRFFDLAEGWENDVKFWGEVARQNGVVLVTSLFEKRADGLYHNTAFVFEKDGSVAGKYRKMHIPDDPGFYEKFYFTPGDIGFEPIDTSVGRLGLLVCWDQWYPEAARLMALRGAKLLIYPTAIGWFEGDESGVMEGIKFWGNSFVFGAQGEELFRADSQSELCRVVEIDMTRSEEVRRIWPFLRDRRIDAYANLTKRFID